MITSVYNNTHSQDSEAKSAKLIRGSFPFLSVKKNMIIYFFRFRRKIKFQTDDVAAIWNT